MARQLSNPVYLASPEKGVDGRTTLAGARAPVITDGRIGDFWIDTRTDEQRLYGPKNAAGWPDLGLIKGNRGWTPVFGVVTDGSRRVQQVIDWQGGEGTKPAIGKYVGPTGLVDTAGAAVDIRGPEGPEMIIDGLTPAVADISDATQLPVAEAGDDNEKRTVVEVFDLGAVLDRRSIAHAQASSVRPAVKSIRIGQHVYERVNAQPNIEAKFRTIDRWTADGDSDSANGGWWRLVSGEGRNFALTLTVGTGGDFATLNDALRAASVLRAPRFENTGLKTEIRLLSGFVLAEQVIVDGLDMSWVEITSVDAEVTIQRSALTIEALAGYSFAAFFGRNNAKLPKISVLFNMDTSGTAALRDGIYLYRQSSVHVSEGCGVKNAGEDGLVCRDGSQALVKGGVFTGAGFRGFYAVHGSAISAESADVSNAKGVGVYALHDSSINFRAGKANTCGSVGPNNSIWANYSSKINASEAEAKNSGQAAVAAAVGSEVNFDNGNADNAALHALYANNASKISANNCSGINAGSHGAYALDTARINCRISNFSGALGDGVRAEYGSFIGARNCTLTGVAQCAVRAIDDSEVHAQSANCNQAGDVGILAIHGSKVSCRSATATQCVNAGVSAQRGSIVHANAVNARKNTASDGSSDFLCASNSILMILDGIGGVSITANAAPVSAGIVLR